jgi:hypothetical protein
MFSETERENVQMPESLSPLFRNIGFEALESRDLPTEVSEVPLLTKIWHYLRAIEVVAANEESAVDDLVITLLARIFEMDTLSPVQ